MWARPALNSRSDSLLRNGVISISKMAAGVARRGGSDWFFEPNSYANKPKIQKTCGKPWRVHLRTKNAKRY